MVDQLTLQTIGVGIAAISVVIGVVNSVLSSRREEKRSITTLDTRQAQLYNNIWNQSMNNPHFQRQFMRFMSLQWNNFDEYIEIFPYNDYESENSMALWGIALFFEGLAPLVKEGLLQIRYLTGTIGVLLGFYWNKLEPVVEEAREHYNDPTAFGQAEYLYNELKKYHEEHPELKT